MGSTGTKIPKVYLPIGLEPVLNRPVKRALEVQAVREVYILTRRAHPAMPGVDLADWADDWRRKYFGNEGRVKPPLFEEDLEQSVIDVPGALTALHRAYAFLQKLPDPPTHVLVLAGDNFIDASLESLVEAHREHPDSPFIATRTLSSRAQASGRFGVVEVDHQGTLAEQVIGYEEKPLEPKTSEVSIGLYLFPMPTLESFVTYLSELTEENCRARAGAPGHFVSWLVEARRNLRAVAFNSGHWIDVGTPSSLLASIVQVTRDLVERPACARDLDVLGATTNLSDKYYFLCHRALVRRANGANTIDLYFDGDDSIATLGSKSLAAGRTLSVTDVRKRNVGKNPAFWHSLGSLNGAFGKEGEPEELDTPVLVSGGVFLVDRGTSPQYARGSALLPLLIRDFAAPVDAGRLTTAAGRMDKLDLMDVCVSEHSEEMIFFGTESVRATDPRLLLFAPPDLREVARQSMLDRICELDLRIPGIDSHRILREQRARTGLVLEQETRHLPPPSPHAWTVSIWFRDLTSSDTWIRRHVYPNLVLLPDVQSATLEFRVLWLASVTSPDVQQGQAVSRNREQGTLGRLHGIFDGDGYGRSAIVVGAHKLIEYVDAVASCDLATVLTQSDSAAQIGLQLVAATDGRSGHFASFDRTLSLAPVTTSVRYLVDLLKKL
jgi:NDP-sugar pyrophosphorylase family protein